MGTIHFSRDSQAPFNMSLFESLFQYVVENFVAKPVAQAYDKYVRKPAKKHAVQQKCIAKANRRYVEAVAYNEVASPWIQSNFPLSSWLFGVPAKVPLRDTRDFDEYRALE